MDAKVGFQPIAMENMPVCQDCLYEIQLTNPYRIAEQLRGVGFQRGDLYPDTQIIAQDIENADYGV